MLKAAARSAPDRLWVPPSLNGDICLHHVGGPVNPRSLDGAFVLGSSGQSNRTNARENLTTGLSNASRIFNLNPEDGGFYQASEPLAGCDGTSAVGHPDMRLIDLMIDELDRDFIAAPCAQFGARFGEWAKGGVINQYARRQVRRVLMSGLQFGAWIIQIGETDAAESLSEATITTQLQSFIDTLREEGMAAPIFVTQTSWVNGGLGSNSANVRAAQAAVRNSGAGVFALIDTDAFGNTYRRDGTHFTDAGFDALAAPMRDAMLPHL